MNKSLYFFIMFALSSLKQKICYGINFRCRAKQHKKIRHSTAYGQALAVTKMINVIACKGGVL